MPERNLEARAMTDFEITADQVKDYREMKGCSMQEAVSILRKRRLLTAIVEAETIRDLKKVLLLMLEENL